MSIAKLKKEIQENAVEKNKVGMQYFLKLNQVNMVSVIFLLG
jgi:hypothetical protein